jgi:hypothetical protein
MFKSVSKRHLAQAALIAAIAVAAGCGEETIETTDIADPAQPPAAATPIANYSGPGSNWDIALNDDGSYAVSRSQMPGMDSNLSISGVFQQTASGFVSMSIDASSGAEAPAQGETAWALEIPGYALLLGSVNTSDEHFVTMVDGGQCPTSDLSGNWITVRASANDDTSSSGSGFFGSLDYNRSFGTTVQTSRFALTNGNPGQGEYSLGNEFCRDGIVTSSTSDIYLAPNGGVTVHVDAADLDDGKFIFALPRTTIDSIADFDGSYAGVLSDEGASAGNMVSPVVVSCSNGICSGDYVTDVIAGTLAGQPFSIDLSGTINVPGPGLTTGELTVGGVTGNIGCMVDLDTAGSGQRVISCAGQSPTSNSSLVNLILAAND